VTQVEQTRGARCEPAYWRRIQRLGSVHRQLVTRRSWSPTIDFAREQRALASPASRQIASAARFMDEKARHVVGQGSGAASA
jgi:hypothetical protein